MHNNFIAGPEWIPDLSNNAHITANEKSNGFKGKTSIRIKFDAEGLIKKTYTYAYDSILQGTTDTLSVVETGVYSISTNDRTLSMLPDKITYTLFNDTWDATIIRKDYSYKIQLLEKYKFYIINTFTFYVTVPDAEGVPVQHPFKQTETLYFYDEKPAPDYDPKPDC